MRRTLLALIFTSLLGVGQGSAVEIRDLTLVDQGKATAAIVIGKAASPTEEYAARELRDYLKKISGAELAIRKEGESVAEATKILIGTPNSNGEVAKLKDVLRCEEHALGRDGLLIKTTENALVLAGSNAPGALYATYTFLEDHLGVRWFFPGDKGEYVPCMQTIKVAAMEDIQKPSLQYRGTNPVFELHDNDTDTWLGRNRMNCRRTNINRGWMDKMKQKGLMNSMLGEETMNCWLPRVATFKEHPEYLSLAQGKRMEKSQPCLSNPNVFAEVKKNILDFLAKNPDTDIFMIGQYDVDQWCQCPNCLAMDAPEDREFNAKATTNAKATNRWQKFVNQLFPEIQKSYPNMAFAVHAYLQTMRAPTDVTPYKGAVIIYCMNVRCGRHTYEDDCATMHSALYGSPAEEKSFGAGLFKWQKCGNPIILYSYIGNFALGLPVPASYLIADEIRFVKKQGMIGWLTEWTPPSTGRDNWYPRKLDNYIAAKLLWNTDANLEKIRADFFQKFYGKAAEPMRCEYETLERAWLSKTDHCSIFGKGLFFLDPTLVEECGKYFDQATAAAAQDAPVIQERVARDRGLFEKLKLVALKPLSSKAADHKP